MTLKNDREYRTAEIHVQNGEEMVLYGHPIVFERPTTIRGMNSRGEMQEYIEIIDRHALDGADMSDTALKHDHGAVLARVRNNSLMLQKGLDSLEMRAVLPDTQKSRDIYTEVRSGLLPEMSFAFPPKEGGTVSHWSRNEDGKPVRRITHIPKLIDVSTAYYGAYTDTDLFTRSLDEMDIELRALDSEKRQPDGEVEIRKRKMKMKENNK